MVWLNVKWDLGFFFFKCPPGPVALLTCDKRNSDSSTVFSPVNETGFSWGGYERKIRQIKELFFFSLSHKTPAECERLLNYAAWEFSAVCETVLRRVNQTNKQSRVTKQKTAGGNNTERSDFIFLLRHRKRPESCQEEEGPLSCGSDSLKMFVSPSNTKAKVWPFLETRDLGLVE